MLVKRDICPKSGLNREIIYKKSIDDTEFRAITLYCDIYYYNTSNESLGVNIFNELKPYELIFNSENTLNGISEYDYWKGAFNDFSTLVNKGFNGYDSCISYLVMKAYLDKKFD